MNADLKEWSADSCFVSEDGALRVFYHGTDCEDPFNVFTRCDDFSLGFHFGSAAAANDRLNQIFRMTDEPAGSLIPVYCRAERSLFLRDLMTWETTSVLGALQELDLITEEDTDFVYANPSEEILYALLEEAGYDSVLYLNECESKSTFEESLMVWRAELLKGIHSLEFRKDDPRLLSQIPTSEDDLYTHAVRGELIDESRVALREFRMQSAAASMTSRR